MTVKIPPTTRRERTIRNEEKENNSLLDISAIAAAINCTDLSLFYRSLSLSIAVCGDYSPEAGRGRFYLPGELNQKLNLVVIIHSRGGLNR